MSTTPNGPFKLVTVNTVPERAFRLIGIMAEALKERYTIVHVDNCEIESAAIDTVAQKVRLHQPDLLFCAPMWTPEQAEQIQDIAREIKPGIITHAIPTGLQPEGIVEYLTENVPGLLE